MERGGLLGYLRRERRKKKCRSKDANKKGIPNIQARGNRKGKKMQKFRKKRF